MTLIISLNPPVILGGHDAGMDALSIASAGLSAAANRYTAGAPAIATGNGDLVSNLTELSQAKTAVEASAAVVRASSEMSKQLVDMLV